MRAWIISDIHSSPMDLFIGRRLDVPDADICICAGDIANNVERSIDFLFAEIAPHMPVVATLGNHDYYGSSIEMAILYARKWTAGTNLHILENQVFEKGDLRVVGATLWTDFAIKAHDAGDLAIEERRTFAAEVCRQHMMDFRAIHRSDLRGPGERGLITPSEMYARHKVSRAFISKELAKPFNGTTMVLTHHAPSAQSLDPRFAGHVTNAGFASDLSTVFKKGKPDFWVHGHVHCFNDYLQDGTRVLCNPRGYHNERYDSGFRPGFVIDTTSQEEIE